MARWQKKAARTLAVLAGLLVAFSVLWLFLQFVVAHRFQPFRPDYAKADLTLILAQETLSQTDYETLYAQTGLAPAGVDALRALGRDGTEQILATQDVFFEPPGESSCAPLGITTREHRFLDEEGKLLVAAPLAPLKEGDIILSFSTHTAGWTHGHAGLVVDPEECVTLESVVLGSLSAQMNGEHWRSYTTMMILRPKSDDETRRKVAELALEQLDGIPYSLVSGVFGDKLQAPDAPHSAHCGYLPWYAWAAGGGLDLDGDGGRIVAPEDLAMSDQVEIVQIYGLDPARYPLGAEG